MAADEVVCRRFPDSDMTGAIKRLAGNIRRKPAISFELPKRFETEGSITVKINRGIFPVWCFLAGWKAIDCPLMLLREGVIQVVFAGTTAKRTSQHSLIFLPHT
jgi:hypothetical protein